MTTTLQLSDKTLADIARNVAKYPPEQKQSAVIDNYSIDVCALVTSRTPKYMLVSVRLKTQHSACPSGATSAPARK